MEVPGCALFVSQILETRRPYLTDCIRCPGLQTSLLLARRLDVSRDCRKVLVDRWLLFTFREEDGCSKVGLGVRARTGRQEFVCVVCD
jgi:hypothetical protein